MSKKRIKAGESCYVVSWDGGSYIALAYSSSDAVKADGLSLSSDDADIQIRKQDVYISDKILQEEEKHEERRQELAGYLSKLRDVVLAVCTEINNSEEVSAGAIEFLARVKLELADNIIYRIEQGDL